MKQTAKIAFLKPAKPPDKRLKPPKNLKKAGKKLWIDAVENYEFELHDLAILQPLCEAIELRDRLQEAVDAADSLTVEDRHGQLKPHPLLAEIRSFDVVIARLRRELNLAEQPDDSRPPPLKFGGKR